MKLIHTYLTIFAGIFSTTLYAQVSTNETAAPTLEENTVTQPAVTVAIEQPASSNETATTAMETPGNGEVASSSLSPTGIPFDNSPYPVILEKMPFGVPPNPDALNAAATSMDEAKLKIEQEKAAAAFSWTAINITPDGKTAIGFTDLSAKPPANYYLTVGESANEWTVIDADYANETATIEKIVDSNKVSISLKFGNKSPIALTPGATPGLASVSSPFLSMSGRNHGRQPSTLQPMTETPVSTIPADESKAATVAGTPSTSHSTLLSSYRDRLNERLKVQENQKQETDRRQKEELSKIVTDALRKQQEEAAAAAAQQQQGEGQPVQPIEVPVQKE